MDKETFEALKIINGEIKIIEADCKELYAKDQQYEDVMNWELQDTDNPIFDAGQLCALKNLLFILKQK